MCDNDRCIPSLLKCNQNKNCLDGSDELNCTCGPLDMRCSSGECLHVSSRCDGVPECMDNSDETSCDICELQEVEFERCYKQVFNISALFDFIPFQTVFFSILYHSYFVSTRYNSSAYDFSRETVCPKLSSFETCLSKIQQCPSGTSISLLFLIRNRCFFSSEYSEQEETRDCLFYSPPPPLQAANQINGCIDGIRETPAANNNCSFTHPYHLMNLCIASLMHQHNPQCDSLHGYLRSFNLFDSLDPPHCRPSDMFCEVNNNYTGYVCNSTAPNISDVRLIGPLIFNNSRLEFHCTFNTTSTASNPIFQVQFLINALPLTSWLQVSPGESKSVLRDELLVGQLGKWLSCRVRSYYSSNSSDINNSSSSNNYFLGVKVSPKRQLLSEAQREAQQFTFTSTLPYFCSTGICPLPYTLLTGFGVLVSTNEVSPCNRTLTLVHSSNSPNSPNPPIPFKNNSPNSPKDNPLPLPYTPFGRDTLHLLASQELPWISGDTGVSGVAPPLSPRTLEGGAVVENYWSEYTFPTLRIARDDRSESKSHHRLCSVSSLGHVLTFDLLSFSVPSSGVFNYISSNNNRIEVQLKHLECGGGLVCVCGVAVREEGAVLVADGCMGGNSPVFLSLPFTQLKKGFRVHVDDSDGKVFQLVAPTVVVYGGMDEEGGMTVQIFISEEYENGVHGLCGNNDGLSTNDLPSTTPSKRPLNHFILSIPEISNNLLPCNDSLFAASFTWKRQKAKSSTCGCLVGGREWCNHGGSAAWGGFGGFYGDPGRIEGVDERFLYVLKSRKIDPLRHSIDFKGFPSGYSNPNYNNHQYLCFSNSLHNYTYHSNYSHSNYSHSNYSHSNYSHSSNILYNHLQPTPLYSSAFDSCYKVLWTDNPIRQACEKSAPASIVNFIVRKCVMDVMLTGTTTKGSLRELQVFCSFNLAEKVKVKNPHLDFNISRPIDQVLDEIRGALSPLNEVLCNSTCQHGACVRGLCTCSKGHTGRHCNRAAAGTPTIKRLLSTALVDYRDSNRHHEVNLLASNIAPQVTCHFEVEYLRKQGGERRGGEGVVRGNVVSCAFDDIIHDAFLPKFKRNSFDSTGSAVIKLVVTLSNGKGSPSNAIQVTAYDSRCVTCDGNGCVDRSDACRVEGFCFKAHHLNPLNMLLSCQPSISISSFVANSRGSTTDINSFFLLFLFLFVFSSSPLL